MILNIVYGVKYFKISKNLLKICRAHKNRLSLHPLLRQRGVAQLVAFLVWDQAVAGSSPVTSTSEVPLIHSSRRNFVFDFQLFSFLLPVFIWRHSQVFTNIFPEERGIGKA